MRTVAGALALLLAGWAGTAAADVDAGSSAPDANLFVYRDAARPAACEAELYLDGKAFASLPQHSYTSLAVPPGIHQLEFRWRAGCGHGDVTNQLDVAPRRLYYFALAGDAQTTSTTLGGAYATHLHETTTLAPVDPDEGVQAVAACCRFVRPFGRF